MAQQFTPATLDSMRGHVLGQRPRLSPTLARDYLNQAVRWALDFKQTWAGTLRQGFITVPAAVSGGTVSLTNGSPTVTLAGSTWVVDDLVDTTIIADIVEPGRHWVTLGSMAGVTTDSVLAVGAGASREICRVYSTRASSVLVDVDYAHAAGSAVQQSSLAGRQFRVTGEYTTYTIESVDSATQLTLTMPWAGASGTGQGYEIVKMYYSLAPDIKVLHGIGDPKQPVILNHQLSEAELNFRDPRRSMSGIPIAFASMTVGPAGNMQRELYPIQRSARQLEAMYSIQWPDMVAANDTPPPFINPDVFTYRSLSMAKRLRLDKEDVGYDLGGAREYERMALETLERAASADDSKLSQQMEFFFRAYGQKAGPNMAIGSWTTMGGGLPFDDGGGWY